MTFPRARSEILIGQRADGGEEFRLYLGDDVRHRSDSVDATRDLLSALLDQGVAPEDLAARIGADTLARHMYAADLPDPDLVIRTSGEARLSGFLLWQSAYAEYSFVDVYWPAFRYIDFLRALRDFTRRTRRYGK